MIDQKFDISAYWHERARACGFGLFGPIHEINHDSLVFHLTDGKSVAHLSASGLELLQNSTPQSLQDLADSRFDKASDALRNQSAA